MDTKYAKITCILALIMVMGIAKSDIAKDRDECANQLVGLATCLPYVGGDAKAPTLDCCTGMKEVLKGSKKCLCILVKDRNDPSLGLKINATLALGLPSACHTPANISECPGIGTRNELIDRSNFSCWIYEQHIEAAERGLAELIERDHLPLDWGNRQTGTLGTIEKKLYVLPPRPPKCSKTSLLNLPPNSPDAKVFEDFVNSSKGINTTTPTPTVDSTNNGSSAKVMSEGGRGKKWMIIEMFCIVITSMVVHTLVSL